MNVKYGIISVAAILILFELVGARGYAASASRPYGSHDLKAESIFGKGKGDFDTHGIDAVRFPRSTLNLPRVPASVILAGRNGSSGSMNAMGSGEKRILVSVVLSAILPGMGELYLYGGSRNVSVLARVPFFLAAEGYFWHGYYHNHKKGKDYKQYYMDYADQHWSLDRFLIQHPCCDNLGGCTDYEDYNEHCQGEFNYFLYTPRDVDEEEYYENIGKYNAFVYGWDDWNDQPDYWTPHRSYYWELRKRSDYYLLKGDNNLMYLLVNRVVSMVDAGWIAYRINKGRDLDKGWSIDVKSISLTPSIIVGYRF